MLDVKKKTINIFWDKKFSIVLEMLFFWLDFALDIQQNSLSLYISNDDTNIFLGDKRGI